MSDYWFCDCNNSFWLNNSDTLLFEWKFTTHYYAVLRLTTCYVVKNCYWAHESIPFRVTTSAGTQLTCSSIVFHRRRCKLPLYIFSAFNKCCDYMYRPPVTWPLISWSRVKEDCRRWSAGRTHCPCWVGLLRVSFLANVTNFQCCKDVETSIMHYPQGALLVNCKLSCSKIDTERYLLCIHYH